MKRPGWLQGRALALVVIVVAAVVLIAGSWAVIASQTRPLDITETLEEGKLDGAESGRLEVEATMGMLDVSFDDLPDGNIATAKAHLVGKAGRFGDENPLNMTFESRLNGSKQIVRIVFSAYAPWPHYSIDEAMFSVVLDRSLPASLDLKVMTGGIALRTAENGVIDGLELSATSDGADVVLSNGTVLRGDMSVETHTGGTTLRGYNVHIDGASNITLKESSGPINATITQHAQLGGVANISAESNKWTRNYVNVTMDLSGDVASLIRCEKAFLLMPTLVPHEGFVSSADETDKDVFVLRSENIEDAQGGVLYVNATGNVRAVGTWTETLNELSHFSFSDSTSGLLDAKATPYATTGPSRPWA